LGEIRAQKASVPVTENYISSGWIGGALSDTSRNLPFVLNLGVLAAGLFVTVIFYRKNPRTEIVKDALIDTIPH
jgi:hypothetical protein